MPGLQDVAPKNTASANLILAALGVVYGDIGTSPLYAVKETLLNLTITEIDVLGVLSLIFWSLIFVITVKYLFLVFRADNDGEGGTLALLALLKQQKTRYEPVFYLLAIFGAGLLVGDGMLTPAISVTSALEGLEAFSPQMANYIVPMACTILILLFAFQHKGTHKIGYAFGPIILVWFVTIAILGAIQIIANPFILKAINPSYAIEFFYRNGFHGYLLLGGIFLVVTGGEALYADIGHFGKKPIRIGWLIIVLPCLLLNYFGQGAYLIAHPHAIENPFYMIAPDWFFIPLVILATLATIIASQAVITATFSLTKQAVLLGLYPKIPIIQTSKEHPGQIYIPQFNTLLMVGTLVLILTFKNTTGLTHAYGIAVNLVMLLVTSLVAFAAYKVWKWSLLKVFLVFSLFLTVDLLFLGANAHKFLTGGWVPVVFALMMSFVMYTWRSGLNFLANHFYLQKKDITHLLNQLHYRSFHKIEGITAIFITDVYDTSGGSFLNFLKLSLTLPEYILLVNYKVENVPYVNYTNRYEINQLDDKICQLTLHYGFMDFISIPHALYIANDRNLLPFTINVEKATFFIELPNIIASKRIRSLAFHWQEKLFAFLMRNYSASFNIEFYQLPYSRTISLGSYYII